MRSIHIFAAAFVTATATTAAAQHGEHKVQKAAPVAEQHGKDHATSGWKELDAYHLLMMETWHPAKASNDVRPARAKAGAMADAARAWAAAAVPAACNTAETRNTVAKLATESRAFADLAAKPAATDVEIKDALKALHDRFEVVEHGCPPGHGGAKH